MGTQVLICDDSGLARKQMARALPQDWDLDVGFAAGGEEAVAAAAAGRAQVLFLDLNMPGMDGYQVLKAIREQDLPTMVIVVSGDIQPEARERVLALGALDFIKKPVQPEKVREILERYGLQAAAGRPKVGKSPALDYKDGLQEVANVAMGRAADLLARLLGAFVRMPIPRVNDIEVGELRMALQHVGDEGRVAAVCQGFIGSGIAGEALVMFDESSFQDMAELLRYEGELDEDTQLELLMDIANLLTGAFLKGMAEQLDLRFSQGHPVVLGRHARVADLLQRGAARWRRTLALEMNCAIEGRDIRCDLLFLFTEDSLPALKRVLAYLMD